MYKSPIEIIYGQMQTNFEDNIYEAIQKYHVNVDKDELIRALRYDREQYEAGFNDGIKKFVDEYKDQIKDYTGMFTDDGFYVSLGAVLSAVDFIKEKLVGVEEDDE